MRRVRGVVVIVALGAAAARADDTALVRGEIVVADRGGAGVAGTLHRLVPGGAPRPVVTNEPLAIPTAVAVDRDGTIVVAEIRRDAPGRVLSVDPASGDVTTIADGWPLLTPMGLAIDDGGDVIVADLDAGSRLDFPSGSLAGTGAIYRVPRATGVPALLSIDCCRWNAAAVAPMPTGTLAVVDLGFLVFHGDGALTLVDPATGVQRTVATSVPLLDPSGVVAGASGTLLVTEATDPQVGTAAILTVEPRTGTVGVVVAGHPIVDPRGIALTAEGDVVVADSGSRTIYQVTPSPPALQVLAAGPPLVTPWGIAVAP